MDGCCADIVVQEPRFSLLAASGPFEAEQPSDGGFHVSLQKTMSEASTHDGGITLGEIHSQLLSCNNSTSLATYPVWHAPRGKDDMKPSPRFRKLQVAMTPLLATKEQSVNQRTSNNRRRNLRALAKRKEGSSVKLAIRVGNMDQEAVERVKDIFMGLPAWGPGINILPSLRSCSTSKSITSASSRVLSGGI